jgi:hypothetical protein
MHKTRHRLLSQVLDHTCIRNRHHGEECWRCATAERASCEHCAGLFVCIRPVPGAQSSRLHQVDSKIGYGTPEMTSTDFRRMVVSNCERRHESQRRSKASPSNPHYELVGAAGWGMRDGYCLHDRDRQFGQVERSWHHPARRWQPCSLLASCQDGAKRAQCCFFCWRSWLYAWQPAAR